MAMGKRKSHQQQPLFIATAKLPQSAAHPFYAKLNEVLAGWKFDEFVEGLCAKFYAGEDRPAVAGAGQIFPPAADRLLRGDRLRTRHRLAVLRFAVAASVRGIPAG